METLKRDYTKFFTPDHIAKYLVSLVNPKTDDVVLEPSAGNGAIERAIKQHNAGVKAFAFDVTEKIKIPELEKHINKLITQHIPLHDASANA